MAQDANFPEPARPVKLSIVIPVYNEQDTIHLLVAKVVAVALPPNIVREIICVNDGSKDGTAASLDRLPILFPGHDFQIIQKPVNEGKGAALRDGFKRASGELVLVQDADLEYDPADYPKLFAAHAPGESRCRDWQPIHR